MLKGEGFKESDGRKTNMAERDKFPPNGKTKEKITFILEREERTRSGLKARLFTKGQNSG